MKLFAFMFLVLKRNYFEESFNEPRILCRKVIPQPHYHHVSECFMLFNVHTNSHVYVYTYFIVWLGF